MDKWFYATTLPQVQSVIQGVPTPTVYGTLRAVDQFVALCLVSHPRCGWWPRRSLEYDTATTAAHNSASEAASAVRLVWEMAQDTRERFAVGSARFACDVSWLIRFEVSPLVLGLVGRDDPAITFEDVRGRSQLDMEWVDSRRRLEPPFMLHDLVTGAVESLYPRAMPPQEPFRSSTGYAVNHVWFVACGFPSDFDERNMLGLSIGRLADEEPAVTSVVVRLSYSAVTHDVNMLFFNKSAPNEVVALVHVRKSPGCIAFLVIDVERSFNSQSLCVLSETSSEFLEGTLLCYPGVLLKRDGSRCFIGKALFRPPGGAFCILFSEKTPTKVLLQQTGRASTVSQLSSNLFVVVYARLLDIWDCNDLTKPLLRIPNTDQNVQRRVEAEAGMLFSLDDNELRVTEPFTGSARSKCTKLQPLSKCTALQIPCCLSTTEPIIHQHMLHAYGTLRAIDQFVALCLVSHPRCGWWSSSSSHKQIAAPEVIDAARLVWEMVQETLKKFAVGSDSLCSHIPWLIKFEVSPLVLGIRGDPVLTFEDVRRNCAFNAQWVDSRRRLEPPYMLHDVVTGYAVSLFPRVMPQQIPWRGVPTHAVNHVWFVACGYESDFREGNMLGLSIGRLADKRPAVTSVVVRLGYSAVTHDVSMLSFNKWAPNELVAVVAWRNPPGSTAFLVIDVEKSFSSKELCVLSETSCEVAKGTIFCSPVLVKRDGSRSFLGKAVLCPPPRGSVYSIQFSERRTTGIILQQTRFTKTVSQLTSHLFVVSYLPENDWLFDIWDCNDSTKPLLRTPNTEEIVPHGVEAEAGLLFSLDGNELRVMEPLTGFTVLHATLPLDSLSELWHPFCFH
ncbi:hypothetical protein Pelo_9210 [Pelomyxa schiedti]|nr:hypothetical protein Pelo_9210 [Pelomyxa schiedti]